MGICCMVQETQTGALYQTRGVGWGERWEGGSKERGYMYTHGWFILKFDSKQQNSVKQLSFNKKFFYKVHHLRYCSATSLFTLIRCLYIHGSLFQRSTASVLSSQFYRVVICLSLIQCCCLVAKPCLILLWPHGL